MAPFDIESGNDTYKSFEATYEGLSANVYMIKPTYNGLSEQTSLRLTNNADGKKFAYKIKWSEITGIGIAVGEMIIPNIKQFQEENARIMAFW